MRSEIEKCPRCGSDDMVIKLSSRFWKASTVKLSFCRGFVWDNYRNDSVLSANPKEELEYLREFGIDTGLILDWDDLDMLPFTRKKEFFLFTILSNVFFGILSWIIVAIVFWGVCHVTLAALVPGIKSIEGVNVVVWVVSFLLTGISLIYFSIDSYITKKKIRKVKERVYYCERCAIAFDKITKRVYKADEDILSEI